MSVRTEPGPAATAQRQHDAMGFDLAFAVGRSETQSVVVVRQAFKAGQTMPNMKAHRLLAQPVQPRAQQGRGLHFLGENPARAADKTLDAQSAHPFAQCFRAERFEHRRKRLAASAVAGEEGVEWFRVRDVHAALAGHQELAPDGRHCVEQLDACSRGARDDFRRHQSGRAAANDGDVLSSVLVHGA